MNITCNVSLCENPLAMLACILWPNFQSFKSQLLLAAPCIVTKNLLING